MKHALMTACLLALLCGCGGGGEELRQFGSLQFNLTTPKTTYTRGEQVPLTFTVKNVGTKTVTSTAPDSNTYVIQTIQGSQVLWSTPTGGGAVITPVSIMPGEIKTFTATWDQKDQQGNTVPPGSYTVNAWLRAVLLDGVHVTPEQAQANLAANPIQITVQGP